MIRTLSLLGSLALLPLGATAGPEALSYNRDVRPILAANCFQCHGPDEGTRKAGLRLDTIEGATKDLGGYQALKPGDPQTSEIMVRLLHADPSERMPPPDSHRILTSQQIETVRRWITGGGNYETHWAFVPPARPALPSVKNAAWPRNEIDRFVLARLEAEGLNPSKEADRYTLVRRVYLDLTGLPPTPEEADAFFNDTDPKAYENLVDRLLASPHYGERWARPWLDLARYSDTNGYEKDRPRSIWPYRDWVIRALNDDLPFDRFTIEQLAGDMLPGATTAQRVATGFHRNTMLNEEGGIDPLEFRFHAMTDRVATTGTVWMGLTIGCAQCHTHKYDPITHTDYYSLMALLNNADEPDLQVPDPEVAKRRRAIEAQIEELEAGLARKFPPVPGEGPEEERRRAALEQSFADWLKKERENAVAWTVMRPHKLVSNLPKLEVLEDGSVFSSGDITKRDLFTLRFRLDGAGASITALRLEALPDERLPAGGPGRSYYEGRKGDFFLSEVTAKANGRPVRFASASHSFGKISIGSGTADAKNVIDGDGSTGWSTATREGEPHQLVLNLAEPLTPSGELEIELLFERHFAASLGRFRISAASSKTAPQASQLPVEVEALLARDAASLTDADRAVLMRQFLRTAPELAEARKQIASLRGSLPDHPETLVMEERPHDNPRKTFRHHRGEYLQPKEEVAPGVPAIFPPLPEGQPANRLTFARWLVSERNPLVARVAVNQAWQTIFGHGIVRTSGDFGTQSEMPSHPELLDWLATELVARGWSMKSLHRLIVTSATYRQASQLPPDLLARDPENRLLARGPRFRVEAELVRDIALKASGLLSTNTGGPSVFPPQPASVTDIAYGKMNWATSRGADRYRRSLYTFSKRTAPFAAYAVFDAPSGEVCIPRRDRSNNALQALTLLNDEMFLEFARAMAAPEPGDNTASPEARAARIFRRCLTRPPSEAELKEIVAFYQSQLARLNSGELDAAKILGNGIKDAELAAWTLVARAILNLDETVTKS